MTSRTLHASPSQCSRVLEVLSDGRSHTVAEIHARAGFMRMNSRVAELRERGHVIECRHIEGAGRGPEAYEYQLLSCADPSTFGTAA